MYDRFDAGYDPKEMRDAAAANRRRSQESFDRCDTDGFLSQWASDITARLIDARAMLVENGGRSTFVGLYDVTATPPVRVAAREVVGASFYGHSKMVWLLRDDAAAEYGRRFVPTGERSRVQAKLGLAELTEEDAAWARIGGSGTGLSGCASARVEVYRDWSRTNQWGTDAVRVDDVEEAS